MRCILRTPVSGLNLLLTWGLFCLCGYAQTSLSNDPPFYGPFNGIFLADGNGLVKKLGEHDSVLKPDSPWSLYCWVYLDHDVEGLTLVAGVGDPSEEYARYIGLSAGRMTLWLGDRSRLDTDVALHPMKWSLLAATFDGTQFHLFVNKRELAIGRFSVGSVRPELRIAPPAHPGSGEKHFAGKIAGLKILREALNIEEVQKLNRNPPDFALVSFEEGSKSWPVQTHGQAGYRART